MSSECESVSMIGTSFLLFHEDEKSSKCEQEPKDDWNRLKKKKFSSHEDEESSKCEQEPKDDWNVLTILSHLMRMRRVPSVSLRAGLESVFNCFSHSRG